MLVLMGEMGSIMHYKVDCGREGKSMRAEERKKGYVIKASLIFCRKKKEQFAYHPQGQLLVPAIALSHG